MPLMYFLEAWDGKRHGPYAYVAREDSEAFELRTELGSLRALKRSPG